MSARDKFERMLTSYRSVFSDPNSSLPFNSRVVARTRTRDENPVYSSPYSYPMFVSNFVNKEIHDLLSQGIKKPSNSSYNNPIWVVNKKGLDSDGKPRLIFVN